jgi:phage protein D
MILQARNARPVILIGGTDYYANLAPFLLSFTYSDNIGKIDDLQLELADPDRRFISESFPLKGNAELDVRIICNNWFAPLSPPITLDCGLFWIDQVDFKGPPHTVSVKANSIPAKSTIKTSNKVRAWEGNSLKDVATQIATENGMSVFWDTRENPKYKRVDQNDKTDLEFLQTLCDDAGLVMKVKRKQIIIFSEKEYEERDAVFQLSFGTNIVSWAFSTKTADTKKESEVKFTDPETGKLTTGKAVDNSEDVKWSGKLLDYDSPRASPDEPDTSGDQIMVAGTPPPAVDYDFTQNDPGNNKGKGAGLDDKATKKAKNNLRKANRDRDTAQIEMAGNPVIAAGQCGAIAGFFKWDGKYFLESVSHKISGGYTTSLNLHRELASRGY